MAKQKMDTGVVTLSNAIGMEITPYVKSGDALILGSTTYDITEIVADTVSITPDDNEVNTTDAEFRDTPLFENVTLGKVQFAATCTDFQNDMMKAIFGWTEITQGTGQTAKKGVVAPLNYQELYCAIVVKFANRNVILPKVKMNSKAVLATLKTGYGEGQLAGTAYAGYVAYNASGDPAQATTAHTTWGFLPTDMVYTILAAEPAS